MFYGATGWASAAGITHISQHFQLWVTFDNYHLSSDNTASFYLSKKKEFKNINQPKDCSLHRNSEYTQYRSLITSTFIARNIAQDYCDFIHKISLALFTYIDTLRRNGSLK